MGGFLKKQFHEMKDRGEDIGIIFFFLGFLLLVVLFILLLLGKRPEVAFVSIVIGLMSFGLGFAAIGISAKADKRHTELLNKIYTNTVSLQEQDMIKGPTGNVVVKPLPLKLVLTTYPPEVKVEKKSKEAAQKRLDEDTQKVGFVRGEIYQLKDGGWGIAWGGKYRL